MLRIIAILITVFFSQSVYAQGDLRISRILDHMVIELSDEKTVELSGIIITDKNSAKEFLIKNYQGQVIKPLPEDMLLNRYGDIMAHVMMDDGRWLQESLIRQGLAYAFGSPSFRSRQRELQSFEIDRIVLNANNPEKIDKSVKGFQIVEGRVVDVVERGRYVYLNFGDDYKTDFTISLLAKDHKMFLNEGFDVHTLKGQRVRMRGWIDHYNGPFIRLTYPEQIERL